MSENYSLDSSEIIYEKFMNNSWKFVFKKYLRHFVFKKIFVCIRVYSCVFVL